MAPRRKHPDDLVDRRPSRIRAAGALAGDLIAIPPEAPALLAESGRQIWNELWLTGNFRPSDAYVIERYASLQERRLALLTTLAVDGFIMSGHRGIPSVRPEARILREIERQLLPLEDRLGLNPEAGLRLRPGRPAPSALATFLNDTEVK